MNVFSRTLEYIPFSILISFNSIMLMHTYIYRYDPEMDGRILIADVDCTKHNLLCTR